MNRILVIVVSVVSALSLSGCSLLVPMAIQRWYAKTEWQMSKPETPRTFGVGYLDCVENGGKFAKNDPPETKQTEHNQCICVEPSGTRHRLMLGRTHVESDAECARIVSRPPPTSASL